MELSNPKVVFVTHYIVEINMSTHQTCIEKTKTAQFYSIIKKFIAKRKIDMHNSGTTKMSFVTNFLE